MEVTYKCKCGKRYILPEDATNNVYLCDICGRKIRIPTQMDSTEGSFITKTWRKIRKVAEQQDLAVVVGVITGTLTLLLIVIVGLIHNFYGSSSDHRSHNDSTGNNSVYSVDGNSDESMSFGEYAARYSSGDNQTAIMFWLAEKRLVNKRMSDYPDYAEKLKFDCGSY